MENRMNSTLNEIKEAKIQLSMEVEAATLETQENANAIINALGEISIYEAKIAIIELFKECLLAERAYKVFQGKR